MNVKAIDLYIQRLKHGLDSSNEVDDADIAEYLEDVKQKDEDKFFDYLTSLPPKLRAETFLELPTPFQADLIIKFDPQGLATIIENLDSDDATDLIIAISKVDEDKEDKVFSLLDDSIQKTIETLIKYEDDEAGSLMQTELLKICATQTINDAIDELVKLKDDGIGSVQSLFVTDENGKLLKTIAIDDLIIEKKKTKLEDILDKYSTTYMVSSHDSIDTVLSIIEKYDLATLGVVDRMGHLIGRITHDDVVDVMEERATKQLYSLNNLDAKEEMYEDLSKTIKTRGSWLIVNLVNVTLASIVIGFFESTLNAIVALAVLMPIVANMAGTSSSQTMTVTIRRLALGEIDFSDLKQILKKEFSIAAVNGFLFGIVAAGIAQVRYEDMMISLSIAIAMFVSFICASVIGASTPMILKKLNIDPAVASSVFVLSVVDIIGFFSFLWVANLIIL